MLQGLSLFVEGRIKPRHWSPQDDLPQRKLKAIEALARYGRANSGHLATLPPTPGVWPTAGVVSWLNILIHMPDLPHRATLMAEAENHLRNRMVTSGTITQFAREREDYWWWLMDSPDGTSARAISALMELPAWKKEIPRLVRGVLSRQKEGHWDTTPANVWGLIMLQKFSRKFESVPVQGVTEVAVSGSPSLPQRLEWSAEVEAVQQQQLAAGQGKAPVAPAHFAWRDPGTRLRFDWPATGSATVTATQSGSGKPWVTIQTRAARKLTAPVYAGFDVKKKVTAVDQKVKGRWSKGDVAEIELTVSASTPWTWVVIDDPVPAGATILGTGLGRESGQLAKEQESSRWSMAYAEKAFDAYRAYYEFFNGGGKFPVKLTYRVRLNNAGDFHLPPTRVEAMYAPENFGEVPNGGWSVAE